MTYRNPADTSPWPACAKIAASASEIFRVIRRVRIDAGLPEGIMLSLWYGHSMVIAWSFYQAWWPWNFIFIFNNLTPKTASMVKMVIIFARLRCCAGFCAPDDTGASGGGACIYRLLLFLSIDKIMTIMTIFSKKSYFMRLLAWSFWPLRMTIEWPWWPWKRPEKIIFTPL